MLYHHIIKQDGLHIKSITSFDRNDDEWQGVMFQPTMNYLDTGTSSTNKNYVMVELGNDDFSSTSIYNDLWYAYYIRSQDSASAIEIKILYGPNDSRVVEKSVNYDYTTNDIFQIMVKEILLNL